MGTYLLYLVFFFALFFALPIYLLVRGLRDPRADWHARAHLSAPYSVTREPTEADLRHHRFRLWVAIVLWASLGCLIAAAAICSLLSRTAVRSGEADKIAWIDR